MKRLRRRLLALLLLPFCYGVAQGLALTFRPFRDVPEGSYFFFAGIASYCVFQWAFFTPIRTYVFGHELTHALAAWMTGGRVREFHVGKTGGHVTLSKTNFFVALAPYMIPLYALILLGAFSIVDHFYPLRAYWPWLLWLLGMAIGFHGALTLYALRQGQSDLKPTGRLLSGVILFLGNAASIIFVMGLLFPHVVSWRTFARSSGQQTLVAWRQIGQGVVRLPPLCERVLAGRGG